MNTYQAPAVGLVELPHLSELLRQLGYRIISGDTFPAAASTVKATLDAAQVTADANGEAVEHFPIIIADVHRPGIKAWAQKLSRTSPVLILRLTGDPYIVAGEAARSMQLPATVGDVLMMAGLAAPDDPRIHLTVDVSGEIADQAPAAPAPVYEAAPVHEAAPTFEAPPTAEPEAPVFAPVAPVFAEATPVYVAPPAPATPEDATPVAPWAVETAAPVAPWAVDAAPVEPSVAPADSVQPERAPWDNSPEAAPVFAPFIPDYEPAPQILFPDPVADVPSEPTPEAPVFAMPAATPEVPAFALPETPAFAMPPATSDAPAFAFPEVPTSVAPEPTQPPAPTPVPDEAPTPAWATTPAPAPAWSVPPATAPVWAPAPAAGEEPPSFLPQAPSPAAPVWGAPPAAPAAPTPGTPVFGEPAAPAYAPPTPGAPVFGEPAAPVYAPLAPAVPVYAPPPPAPVYAPPAPEAPVYAPPAFAEQPPAYAPPAAPAWAPTPPAVAPTYEQPVYSPVPEHAPAPPAAPLVFQPPVFEQPPAPFAAPPAPTYQPPAYVADVPQSEGGLFDGRNAPWTEAPVRRLQVNPNDCPVIFDWAYKGGVNKTSLSLQLAHRAAEKGLRVWLVDMNRGQGGIRAMLRIADDAPIRSSFDAVRNGDVRKAFVLPAEAQKFRTANLEPLKFGVVLAPPRAEADPEQVTYTLYRQIIEYARSQADLVVVDTQTVEATDTSGLIDNVMIPMMVTDAFGLAITEFGKESVDNLKAAFGLFGARGLPRDRQMLVVTRVTEFTETDVINVDKRFHDYANFAGTTAQSDYVKDQFDRGRIVSDDPSVTPLLDTVLLRVTGDNRFDPQVQAAAEREAPAAPGKAKKRFFGGGRA